MSHVNHSGAVDWFVAFDIPLGPDYGFRMHMQTGRPVQFRLTEHIQRLADFELAMLGAHEAVVTTQLESQ